MKHHRDPIGRHVELELIHGISAAASFEGDAASTYSVLLISHGAALSALPRHHRRGLIEAAQGNPYGFELQGHSSSDAALNLGVLTMANRLIVVKAARDEEAGVWYVEASDLPGLNAEAETLEALVEKLPNLVLDLIEEGALDQGDDDGDQGAGEFSIELIAHASTRVRIPAAA